MRQVLFFVLLAMTASTLAQDPPPNTRKPRLIRDDQTQATPAEEVIVPNLGQAKEHVKIGDFYFRRKNYKAAVDRYEEAVKYGPTWIEPYDKLAAAYDQLGEVDKAVDVCLQFLDISTDSGALKKITERLEKLQKKQQHKPGSGSPD